ncbi:MAG: hypothetical protein WAK00_00945 [Microbacterium sp.]|uniref:hypothetical protein n=1 Tax=Microbacterium sp. TaxID=51671 RepID=UPI003BB02481
MPNGNDPIDDQKPTADLQEQERPEIDDPDDPEAPPVAEADFGGADADPADVAEQREEVLLDEDHPRE